MAKRVPSQNTVLLDQVAVNYDPATGSIRIICADEELSSSFALGVQKNGKLEQDLLALLAKHGITSESSSGMSTDLPQSVDIPLDQPLTPKPETKTATVEKKQTFPKVEPILDWSQKGVIPPVRNIPQIDINRKGNLVTLVSTKKRTATSLSTVMLGAALVRMEKFNTLPEQHKVVVVDFDLRGQGLSKEILNNNAKGLLDIYDSGIIDTATVMKNIHYDEKLGIHVLPVGDLHENPLNFVGEKFMERTIEVLREIFTVVLVDTPDTDVTYVMPWLIEHSDIILFTSVITRGTEYDLRTWLTAHVKYQRTVKKLVALLTNVPRLQIMASFEDVKKIFNPFSIVGNIPTDSAGFLTAVKNNTLNATFENHNMVADAYLTVASRFLTAE